MARHVVCSAPRGSEDLGPNRKSRMRPARGTLGWILVGMALAVISVAVSPRSTGAVEVGERAPDFTLPSTTGGDISLRDFRGKKFVLLEFYGADFAPT